jgi:phage baseplate assembly protein W
MASQSTKFKPLFEPKAYRGFSSIGAERSRTWQQTDIELVKRDILNHFMTHVGERVMRPDFGCRIWDWLMDPLTEQLRQDIIMEAQRVVSADRRVTLVQTLVFSLDNGLRIELTLDYIGLNVIDTFYVDFELSETA